MTLVGSDVFHFPIAHLKAKNCPSGPKTVPHLCIVKVFTHNFHMYIYFYDLVGSDVFHFPIAHLKAKNCPSGPKTVPPRNLIVI